MAHWTIDISKYAEKKGKEIKDIRRAYAFALYASIVKKTPVDTGRARGNWNISVGKVDSSTDDNRKGIRYKGTGDVPNPNGDESIFISNNLPYIETLEYGGYPNPPKGGKGKTVNGFSKQAPNGMVGVTLANNENIFNAAVKAVKGSKE